MACIQCYSQRTETLRAVETYQFIREFLSPLLDLIVGRDRPRNVGGQRAHAVAQHVEKTLHHRGRHRSREKRRYEIGRRAIAA